MGKKNRRERTVSSGRRLVKLKTVEERQQQVSRIRQQLMSIQLDERLSEIQKLFSIMTEYVENGEPVSGKIPLSNSNKVIHFILSNRSNVDCKVNICAVQKKQ